MSDLTVADFFTRFRGDQDIGRDTTEWLWRQKRARLLAAIRSGLGRHRGWDWDSFIAGALAWIARLRMKQRCRLPGKRLPQDSPTCAGLAGAPVPG